jgi:hypothetical protein
LLSAQVTSQGSAYGRFRRLLEHRQSLTLIRAAAAELPAPMPLDDALELCLLFLELDPERFDAAAARWAGRLILERRLVVADAQLALFSDQCAASGGAARGRRGADLPV